MKIHQDTYKHKGLRKQLTETLKSKGIRSVSVLNAIAQIPRHYFLPLEFEAHAYEDKAFPIGEDQTISQPYTVAYQTQLLEIRSGDKVLEIGTGSGYQGSVLSLCGAEVYSIERIASLSATAAAAISEINSDCGLNIKIKMFTGDGTKGLAAHAPYDKIIVTAGAPSVPKALISQLRPGGVLVIPVGKQAGIQKMLRITKTSETDFRTEMFEDFSFVPLVGENGWKP